MSMPGTLPFSSKSHHSIPNEAAASAMGGGGDLSPPGASNSSSAHEFSVFANVNIQGSSTTLFSQSQANLSSIATSVTDFSDTISLSSAMMSTAPELPKRSNSIISLAGAAVAAVVSGGSSSSDAKPILSPRLEHPSSGTLSRHHPPPPPVISPKCLDTLKEERNASGACDLGQAAATATGPPTISPRIDKFSSYHESYGGSGQQQQSTSDTGINANNRLPFQNSLQQRHNSSSASNRNSSYSLR